MIKVGITGGIGSGKSTICEIFKILKVPVYHADSQAKLLMNTDADIKKSIKKSFGDKSYEHDQINRSYLAQRVFNSGDEILKLNKLVHPVVKKDFENWAAAQTTKYVIKEAALLIENKSYTDLDSLIVVETSEKVRVERILKRDSFRKLDEIHEILKKQVSDSIRIKAADYIIKNEGNELIIPQVMKIHERFMSLQF